MGFFKKLFGKKEPEKIVYAGKGATNNSNNRNNTSRPVWRMADGTIDCPGDTCPKTCDETCPIYCQTLAVPHFHNQNLKEVERLLRKAISLEPELSDSWSTLGTCRGIAGDNEEAYRCFKKAYDLGRRNQHVLDGLLVSCQHTKRPDEGLKYCAEYEKYDKAKSDRVRKVFQKMKTEPPKTPNPPRTPNKEESTNQKKDDSDDYAFFAAAANAVWDSDELIELIYHIVDLLRIKGRSTKFYNRPVKGNPRIPELLCENPTVVGELCRELSSNGMGESHLMVAGAFYVGHTAVTLWHLDWDKMKAVGVETMLTNPIVINRIVEFVNDLVNADSERHEMSAELHKLAHEALEMARQQFSYLPEDKAEVLTVVTAMMAMNIFGMQHHMHDLGMR